MIKILFLIHDLGNGGAEKVLVNLVNNMNREKFDITVMALFGGGVNEQFLASDIKYKAVFPKEFHGNSKIMKLLSPERLHKLFVKDIYDIEVSYLEGPSARVISGCRNPSTKLVTWIHTNIKTKKELASAFRNTKEAIQCYKAFDKVVAVSELIKEDMDNLIDISDKSTVLYNTVESEKILVLSHEKTDAMDHFNGIKLIAVGTLKPIKGYDRLLHIMEKFKKDSLNVRLYILGKGPLKQEFENYVMSHELQEYVSFLGYDTNPYKYMANSDLFLCSSHVEGFSTATTESLILGLPVCTVEVSGMKEMLGENNEFGIVTKNDEHELALAIEDLITDKDKLTYYKRQAQYRGKFFSTEKTVSAVENMFTELIKEKHDNQG